MQREIKFRAWDTQSKKMYYEPAEDGFLDDVHPTFVLHHRLFPPHDQRFELMQFTGLHDKAGKPIYEGDIVSLGKNVNQRRVIGWWEDTHGWGYVYPTGEQFQEFSYDRAGFMKDKMEIIGNVFENPELLTDTSSPSLLPPNQK